jgi:hypothetical protein
MDNVRPIEEVDLEILREAEHALKTVNETTEVANRPIIGIGYPYFVVFGLAILLSYSSGQYLPPPVAAITAGWIWFILAPVCQFIGYFWYRYESKRYGVLRNDLAENFLVMRYFVVFCAVGVVFVFVLVAVNRTDYIFPMWVIITSIVYVLWGYKFSRMLLGLGIVNFFVALAVVIWFLNYSFLLLGISMGGGNLLLGLIAWWQLQNYKSKRQKLRVQ